MLCKFCQLKKRLQPWDPQSSIRCLFISHMYLLLQFTTEHKDATKGHYWLPRLEVVKQSKTVNLFWWTKVVISSSVLLRSKKWLKERRACFHLHPPMSFCSTVNIVLRCLLSLFSFLPLIQWHASNIQGQQTTPSLSATPGATHRSYTLPVLNTAMKCVLAMQAIAINPRITFKKNAEILTLNLSIFFFGRYLSERCGFLFYHR